MYLKQTTCPECHKPPVFHQLDMLINSLSV